MCKPLKPNDERFTPPDLLLRLHARYKFTVDIASCAIAPAAQIIPRYFTKEMDVFRYAPFPKHERIFCNPPYSDILPWVDLLWRQPCFSFMLVPAWTDRKWWQLLVEPYRDQIGSRLHTQFTDRVTFWQPDAAGVAANAMKEEPKFIGSVYLIFDQVAA